MRRAVSILCMLAVLPLALAFARIFGELPPETSALVREKYATWSGVLRVWVYEGWDAGAMGWLNRAIASFEKQKPGVYVQAKYVDAEAIRAFAESGINPPDMVIVPPGLLAGADNLLELDGLPKLKDGLAECGDGALAPVMMGAYGWAYNRRMLDGLPASWEATKVASPEGSDWSSLPIALVPLCSGATEVEIEPPGLDLGLPASADVVECRLPAGFAPSKDAYSDFISGRAAAIPVTQREVKRLTALAELGRGPDWAVSASGSAMLADQLLLLGVVDWPREDILDRQALSMDFLRHLLSDEVQQTLSSAGAFPVVATASLYQNRAGYDGLEIASNLPLIVPGAFSSPWRDLAGQIAQDFFAGGVSAREGLDRLREAISST
ncbi:MAG: hypothetical protein BWY81_00797 [Firmicutes bacterium ADurb.Bin467]|nr:MAG: hypothetical protein BWY81_00797 [Firmicutes bacterium ADurb.Bin467]